MMDESLFLGLPRFLKDIAGQVTLGGGEPTLYPELVERFAQECRDYGLICNLTTNGFLVKDWEDEKIEHFCENLTITSVSLDYSKYEHWKSGNEFLDTCKKLKEHNLVGCNLLTDQDLMRDANLIKMTDRLFERGLDRVFSLYPKNIPLVHGGCLRCRIFPERRTLLCSQKRQGRGDVGLLCHGQGYQRDPHALPAIKVQAEERKR